LRLDPRHDWIRVPGATVKKGDGRVFRVGDAVQVHDVTRPLAYPFDASGYHSREDHAGRRLSS
jgi:hypothetical protein